MEIVNCTPKLSLALLNRDEAEFNDAVNDLLKQNSDISNSVSGFLQRARRHGTIRLEFKT